MVVRFHYVRNNSDQNLSVPTALFDEMFIFQSKEHFFKYFYKKVLARGFKTPIMHRTQRRTVVKYLSFQVRRCFLLFDNISDNLCGHLLIDLFLKYF